MGRGFRAQHELVMVASADGSLGEFDPKASRGNVIQAKRSGNPLHPTQKPVELLAAILGTASFLRIVGDPLRRKRLDPHRVRAGRAPRLPDRSRPRVRRRHPAPLDDVRQGQRGGPWPRSPRPMSNAPAPVTPEQQAVHAIRGLIAGLPRARASAVVAVADKLREAVHAAGDDGRITFALVGAELAAEG